MTGFYIDMIINGAIFMAALIILIHYFRIETSEGKIFGARAFRFFTTLSNLFSAFSCLLVLIVGIKNAARGCACNLPSWLHFVKFMSTQTVMLTFFTVMVFLGPTKGYVNVLKGTSLHMHLIGPLLALISLCLFENAEKITFVQAALAVIPTVLYAFLYQYKVLKQGEDNGGWPDFYGFNRRGRWKLSVLLVILGSALTSLIIMAIHNNLKGF